MSLFVNTALAPNGCARHDGRHACAGAGRANAGGRTLRQSLPPLLGVPAYGRRLFDENGAVVLDQVATRPAISPGAGDGPDAGHYVDTDYGMLLDRFKKGEFAYFVDGPWAIGDLTGDLGDNLAVAPAGRPGRAGAAVAHADGASVNPEMRPNSSDWRSCLPNT